MKIFKFILLFLSSFLLYTNVYAESNLKIESVKATEKSASMVVDHISFEDTTIHSQMDFYQLNDFVTYEVEIKNYSDKTYTLAKIIDHLNTDYLDIESGDVGIVIDKNERKTIHVKVKYIDELINVDSFVPEDSSITLNFVDITKIENPFTLDIFYTIFIAGILVLVIVGLISYYKKLQKIVGIFLLFFLPIFVFAQEMLNVNFIFDQVTVHGRFLSYRVQIDDGSGSVDDYTKTYGDTVGDLPVPEKTGYTFEGWHDQNDRIVNSDTVVEEDLHLTASYGLVHYSISYNIGDGVFPIANPVSYTVEDEFTLYNPVLEGYTFQGWVEAGSNIMHSQVTIYPGTTGNKSYTAFYAPGERTQYTVIHKQMNLEGVYEETERETLYGETDSSVTPQPKEYTGFEIPTEQTITILGDGSSTVTYLYERKKYSFVVHHREDLESATEDGAYYYGTRINIHAKTYLGYTLSWNDGSTLYERSFSLEDDTVLVPTYTANTNTPYKVIHRQMNLDGSTYSLKDEETFTGETDTNVTPQPNTYEGFTSPEAQELTITGDGQASITYRYVRNKYQLTIQNESYVETTTPSGEYYYGTSITLTAKEASLDFLKWSNGDTTKTITFELKGDTTIRPIYSSGEALEVNNFEYTGGEQTYVIPETGYYKLEVWGAQGGNSSNRFLDNKGGFGSYSKGFVYLEEGTELYINVGGTAEKVTDVEGTTGGYNGGGNGGKAANTLPEREYFGGAGGGGASHIALRSGLLSSLVTSQSDVLVVAGGGGGATSHWDEGMYGGAAGGISGSQGQNCSNPDKNTPCSSFTSNNSGGTQTTGYSFGKGQDGLAVADSSGWSQSGRAGAGGGWYGGYASQTNGNGAAAGGGGSGYIGNSSLIDKYMVCYQCQTSNNISTKTISNQCHSSTAQEDCSKENHGFARVSYYGFDYVEDDNNVIRSWNSSSNTDFHNSSIRNTITEIEFVNTYDVNVPNVNNTTSWDVSENQDGGVIAWLDGTKLYIGGKNGVTANEDSSYIFSYFPNLTTIHFNDLYDTSNVTNMSNMFRNSVKLDTLDLSSFDTKNVTNMSFMFSTWNGTEFLNSTLRSIQFGSGWNTSKVTNMQDMFSGLNNITYLELETFDTSKVTTMYHMYHQCKKLRTIYASTSYAMTNVSTSASEGMFYGCGDLIGGNGTKYNSSYTNYTYAKIDKSGQTGYFTDYRQGLDSNNQRLQYIQSNGSQHIDTYYYAGPDTVIELEYMISDTRSSTRWAQITGAKSSYHSSSAIQVAYRTSDKYMAFDYGTYNVTYPNQTYTDNTKYYYKVQNNNHYLNTTKGTQNGTLTETSPYSLWIFDCNEYGVSEYPSTIRLYSYKISEGSTVKMNLVPVHNTYLNKNGLYDTVNKRFYYTNTGNPTAGPSA